MALENVLNCPVCGSTHFKNFLVCQDHTTSHEKFNLSSCSRCNFVFTNPRPSASSIGSYYKSDTYISHTGSRKGLLNLTYHWVRTYTLRWKVRLLKEYKQTGSLLDYGCGTGEFLSASQKSGFLVSGVEPSEEARRKAETLIGHTLNRDISELVNKKFDIITLWHVLEHITDLKEKLNHLKELLKEQGIICIAVPNRESYDAAFYKEHWAGYDVPRHLSHFSRENMAMLLHEMNFSLLAIKPMKLDSFYVSLLSENYLNTRGNALTRFMYGILTGWKSNRRAEKTLDYSSLIYIARP
jgi:2-polyprenyl-3-methyl-5-hydroxy-6-metoxy-1,4-benzoquinol methylase